jgi:hypothetical protein
MSTGGFGMITEQRNPKRLRRQRDVLLEAVYEVARIECRRLTGAPSPEFRKVVDALEEFDAAEAAREHTASRDERAAGSVKGRLYLATVR